MRNELYLLSLVLIYFTTGCKKDDSVSNSSSSDHTPPAVYINGDSLIEVILNSSYTEPGAFAINDSDTIAVTTSGNVNVNRTGTYTIRYSATDQSGNVGFATRTVRVYNQAEIFVGTYYNCTDTCSTSPLASFVSTVTASDSVNKMILIRNFGSFGNDVIIYASVSSNAVNAPVNVATGQSLGINTFLTQIYQGQTYVLSNTQGATSFKIKYKWEYGSSGGICNSTYVR